ncbi:A/G-specific adenine glycosylase [Porphyromonas crevioricanis]|uniref:A/G-specific adenine glycosylase n=1 Tax=Porphyromonas crevioricanis TaxID=393921 RepID=UPI0005A7CE29|nr:A/G-specific adenine glycosylase [Porphyromonas crevioricanis]SJZ84362.1 A/G-specific DNA-adenine glycosylase [Porphyromonas crevioricanis]
MPSLSCLPDESVATALFRRSLIGWYERDHRPLPWRETANPYFIWLSEVILQQTRVEQGTAYYHRFIEAFPTVFHLADADEDQVLKLWQGLGYYSRARNLRVAAQRLLQEYGGSLPADRKKLLALPGIGPYTAAAILSFAYDLPFVAVDGNVQRVVSRLFALPLPVDSPQGKKEVDRLADLLLDREHPRLFNNATMELGATVCLPVSPRCSDCPVADFCLAQKLGTAEELPLKSPKRQLRDRYFHYIDVRDSRSASPLMLLGRRGGGDIWQGLYQPLLVETPVAMEPADFLASDSFVSLKRSFPSLEPKGYTSVETHVLTHQRIHARLYRAEADLETSCLDDYPPYQLIMVDDLPIYAFPRLLEILWKKGDVLF